MCFLFRAMAVVSLTFLLAAGSAFAVSKRTYRAWSRVARCESGGWHVLGSSYPDPLGITFANWLFYGRRALGRYLRPMAYTGPYRVPPMRLRLDAIRVAVVIRRDTGAAMPDQFGACYSW